MKNLLQSLLIICIISGCKAPVEVFQTSKPTNIGVKVGFIRGTIFTADYSVTKFHVAEPNPVKRFTPTKSDIEQAMIILRQVGKENTNKVVYRGNLNNYFMQCVGFVNQNGDRVIHINFLWNKYPEKDISKIRYEDDYTIAFDGGNAYWNVNINLTTQQATDLFTNGTS